MQSTLVWIDRLPYGLLGCCGNTEAETPGFDGLAAASVTFDNCIATDAVGDGCEVMAQTIVSLAGQGVDVNVIAEDETVLVRRLREASERLRRLDVLSDRGSFLQCITEVIDGRRQAEGLTVISLSGLADIERDRFSDVTGEGARAVDDVIHRLFVATSDRQAWNRSLLFVAGAVGVVVTTEPDVSTLDRLREPRVHVPLIGRGGPSPCCGVRSRSLVTTADVAATIAEFNGIASPPAGARSLMSELRGEPDCANDAVLIAGPDGWYGLRTQDWYLMAPTRDGDAPLSEAAAAESAVLFVKPNDLWDQLDLAGQSREIVEGLVSRLFNRVAPGGEWTEKGR